MSYKKHAEREFKAAGWMKEDGTWDCGMQKTICTQVMGLLKSFSSHGHSGSTAPYAIDLFKKLASFEPIVPITGNDCEWNEVGEGTYQNNRCSHVFKDSSGRAYDIQGKIFRESNGCCYTSGDSHVDITFPYTPKTEYIDVEPTTTVLNPENTTTK